MNTTTYTYLSSRLLWIWIFKYLASNMRNNHKPRREDEPFRKDSGSLKTLLCKFLKIYSQLLWQSAPLSETSLTVITCRNGQIPVSNFNPDLGHLLHDWHAVNSLNLIHNNSSLGDENGTLLMVNFLHEIRLLDSFHFRVPLNNLYSGLKFLRLQNINPFRKKVKHKPMIPSQTLQWQSKPSSPNRICNAKWNHATQPHSIVLNSV